MMTSLVSSCGSKKEKKDEKQETKTEQAKPTFSVKPDTTAINGELNSYFSIEDREYQLASDGWSYSMTIQLKTNKKFSESLGDPELELQIFDANGNMIEESTYSDGEDALVASNVGETNAVKFSSLRIEENEKPASFRLVSKIDKPEPETTSSYSSSNDNSSSASSDNSSSSDDDSSDNGDKPGFKDKVKKGWGKVKSASKNAWKAGKEAWKEYDE